MYHKAFDYDAVQHTQDKCKISHVYLKQQTKRVVFL